MASFKKEWLTDLEQARVAVENAINKEVSCTPPSASNVRSALKRVRDDIFREWPKPAHQPLLPGLRINFADETLQTAAADALAGDDAKRCGTCGAPATIAWRYAGDNEMYLEDAKNGRRWPRCENHPPNRAEYKSEPLLKPAVEKSRARAAARNAALTLRVTPAQRRALLALAGGENTVDRAYATWKTRGAGAGTFERTLGILADRGLVDWSGGVSDVTITEAGRKALGAWAMSIEKRNGE